MNWAIKYEKFWIPFFSQSSGKNINLFKPEMEGQLKQHRVIIHTYMYIYQIGAFKFRWLVRMQDNWWVIFAEWTYKSYQPGRTCIITHDSEFYWSIVLLDRYMCVWWHSAVSYTSISVLKRIDIFLWTLWGNFFFSNLFIFSWTDSLYTI